MPRDKPDDVNPYGSKEILSEENQTLIEENHRLRQYLELVKENCELHTLNFMTYALSMNDVKLRKFYTDIILPRTERLLSNPPAQINAANQSRRESINNGSFSYGKSFPEIREDDIQSSYGSPHFDRSDSYGKSFQQIDINELQDSRENRSNGQSFVKSYGQQSPRDTPAHGGIGYTQERVNKSWSLTNIPNAEKQLIENINKTSTFFDSLESNVDDDKCRKSINNPPASGALHRNPYISDQENRQEYIDQDSMNIPYRRYNDKAACLAVNESQLSDSGHSLHASDLGYSNRSSAFRPYKKDPPKYKKQQVETPHHQNYTDRRVANSPNSFSLPREGVPPESHRNRTHENQNYGSESICQNPCRSYSPNHADDSLDRQSPLNERSQTPKRGFVSIHEQNSVTNRDNVSKHTSNDRQTPKKTGDQQMLVRINTTFGHVDENGKMGKSQFTGEYAVPCTDASPIVRERVLTTSQTGVLKGREAGHSDHGTPVLHKPPISHSYETSTQNRTLMSNGSTSGQRYFTPTGLNTLGQQHGIVRFMRNDSESGLPTETETSVFLHDRNAYSKQVVHPRLSPKDLQHERPKSVTFDLDRFKDTIKTSQMTRGQGQGRNPEKKSPRDGLYNDKEADHASFLSDEPIATSTPKRSPRDKVFREERQTNREQLDQYILEFTGSYETARSSLQPSPLMISLERSPRQQTDLDPRNFDRQYTHVSNNQDDTRLSDTNDHRPQNAYAIGMTRVRPSSAPIRQFDSDGMVQPTFASEPGRRIRHKSKKRGDSQIFILLADILGVRGNNAKEKVESYIYRPIDVLIGYQPEVTSTMCRLLVETLPNKSIIGEIAFQLDRRILEFVIRGTQDETPRRQSFRYYGYSLANISKLIVKEATEGGVTDPQIEITLRKRFEAIKKKLRSFDYQFHFHAEFTQNMVNKYGLLNVSSQISAVERNGLSDKTLTRLRLCQILKSDIEIENMLIIHDCLCYLSFEDERDLFLC